MVYNLFFVGSTSFHSILIERGSSVKVNALCVRERERAFHDTSPLPSTICEFVSGLRLFFTRYLTLF